MYCCFKILTCKIEEQKCFTTPYQPLVHYGYCNSLNDSIFCWGFCGVFLCFMMIQIIYDIFSWESPKLPNLYLLHWQ